MNRERPSSSLKRISAWFVERPIIIMLLISLVFIAIFIPDFYRPRNIRNYFIQCSDVIIFACGLLFVILNGSIDFSSAAVIGMGSLLIAMISSTKSGWLPDSPMAIPLAMLSAMALSVVLGLINGFAVTSLKIPSFIATMSTNMILMGVALTVSMSATISGLPSSFTRFAKNSVGFVPNLCLVALAVLLLVSIIIQRSAFGRRALSVGSNPTAAFISGIPVKKTIMQLFLINGILTGLGVIVFTMRMGVGKAGLGDNRTMDFVASVIIGGTSPSGGSATVLGTLLGAMFITLIDNSLNMLGLPWYTIMIVKGVFVVVMSLVDAYRRNKQQQK